MSLITYADKQAMGTQPTIPDVNKVTDSDMNEIKTAINNSTTYSTNETVIGEWIDGKIIYRKTIDFGALPNNTTKEVNHNISNLDYIIDIKATSYNSTSGLYIPLPHVNVYGANYGLEIYMNNTKLTIVSASNMSAYTKTYVTIEYTKTTD